MFKTIKKILTILYNFPLKLRYKQPLVMSDEETIDYIVNNECSIARYGDGELSIMLGNDISWFQSKSKELKERLLEISKINNKKLLICIPEVIGKDYKCKLTEGAINFWNKHKLFYGGYYNNFFRKQNILGDTNVTRFYLGVENKERTEEYVKKIKRIWQNKNLLIIEGYNTKLGIDNDLFDNSKSIRRILCPNKNAFDKYDEILNSVIDNYKNDDLVIIALGPTATVLASDLCINHDIRSLDLGHIDIEYMWYLNNDDKRGNIENKNTAEKSNYEFDEDNITENTIEIIN